MNVIDVYYTRYISRYELLYKSHTKYKIHIFQTINVCTLYCIYIVKYLIPTKHSVAHPSRSPSLGNSWKYNIVKFPSPENRARIHLIPKNKISLKRHRLPNMVAIWRIWNIYRIYRTPPTSSEKVGVCWSLYGTIS